MKPEAKGEGGASQTWSIQRLKRASTRRNRLQFGQSGAESRATCCQIAEAWRINLADDITNTLESPLKTQLGPAQPSQHRWIAVNQIWTSVWRRSLTCTWMTLEDHSDRAVT